MNRIIYWQRYAGIATVVIIWVFMLAALLRANLSIFGQEPLSSLGVSPSSATYFSIGLILAAISTFIFGYYINRVFTVPRSFNFALIIGQLGQVIAALVPFGGEQPAREIHTYAAFTLAFSLPVLMWRFAVTQKSLILRGQAYWLMWLEIAAFIIGIGTFVLIRKGAPFGQMLPAIGFHIWLVFVSLKSFGIVNKPS